jgi:hypothetical protein
VVNGWVVTKGLGVYGTNYMKRAVVAAFGWPANLSQDAVYPYTEVDSSGRKLSEQTSTRSPSQKAKRRLSTLSGRSRCMKSINEQVHR